ncbi:hypothetical protein N7527_002653 [Penicillium freii]|nr:hypothetical protein N7527_002653 [Penicillium freii]
MARSAVEILMYSTGVKYIELKYCGEQSEGVPLAGAKTFRSDHLAQLLLFPSLPTALTTGISAQFIP